MSRTGVVLALCALLLLSVVPIVRTLSESFVRRGPDGSAAWTTEFYERAFVPAEGPADPAPDATPATRPVAARVRMLGNSLLIASVSALLALLAGVPFALLVFRTDLPGARLLRGVYAAPLVLPPLVVAIAWTMIPMFQPPARPEGVEPSPWDGVVGVLRAAFMFALCYFPLVVLFTGRALRRVPASLEEAARIALGPWRAVRRVTLPLVAPAALAGGLFVFLFALNDFALVDFVNWVRPLSQQVSVYPFEAFVAWSKSQGAAIATALGAPMLLVGVVSLWGIHRLVGRVSRVSVSGDFRAPEPWALGRLRWPALAATAGLLAVAVGVPLAGLAWKAGGLASYREVWRRVAGAGSAENDLFWTLWLSAGAALIALPIAFVLGHHAARRGRMWPLLLALLPLALPPVFLGVGYLKLLGSAAFTFPLPGGGERNPFLDADGPRLGAMLLLVAKYLPFALAALWAAFLAVDPRLEEAAATAGVRRLDRALGVLVPLVRPALALAFVLVLVFSLREIDTIVLLNTDTLMRRIYTMVHTQRDSLVAALALLLVALQGSVFAVLALLVPRGRDAAAPRAATR